MKEKKKLIPGANMTIRLPMDIPDEVLAWINQNANRSLLVMYALENIYRGQGPIDINSLPRDYRPFHSDLQETPGVTPGVSNNVLHGVHILHAASVELNPSAASTVVQSHSEQHVPSAADETGQEKEGSNISTSALQEQQVPSTDDHSGDKTFQEHEEDLDTESSGAWEGLNNLKFDEYS